MTRILHDPMGRFKSRKKMEEKKEIELIDYLDVIWRKKFLIVIPTFLLMLMAGYCSFRAPRAFAVDAIIAPSTIMLQTPGGRLEKIQVVDPLQLAIRINQGSYNAEIAAALNLDPYEVAVIMAENLRDPQSPQYLRGTDLVHVSMVDMDQEKAKRILEQLYRLVKIDLDAKIEVEAQSVDSRIEGLNSRIREKEVEILENENQMALTALEIKDKEQEIKVQENEIVKKQNDIQTKKLEIESIKIEKDRIGSEITNFQNKIKIVDKRIENLQVEIEEVNAKLKELEAQQKLALAAKKTEDQAISLLLYSNEIQRSLQYGNDLEEKLHTATIDRENLVLEIHKKEELLEQRDNKIRQVDAQIATIQANIENNQTQKELIKNQGEKVKKRITSIKNANEKILAEILAFKSEIKLQEGQKARISYTELVKAPGPALMAVGRNPLYMVVIVGFISGLMFMVLAFLIDYIQKNRKRPE
jgi:LPS O-antigen subunit length determinant protein (WzzB/FepE family)